MTDEQLDKGETGDKVWDAAQYQLALTGLSRHPCGGYFVTHSVRSCTCQHVGTSGTVVCGWSMIAHGL